MNMIPKAPGFEHLVGERPAPPHLQISTGLGDPAIVLHCDEMTLFANLEGRWIGMAQMSLDDDGRPHAPLAGTYQSLTIDHARRFAAGLLELCNHLEAEKGLNS